MNPSVSKYHLENVRSLQTLAAPVRAVFYEFLVRLAVAGIRVRITSAQRTAAEQDALYAQGRTAPGPVVTYVRGNNSWHVFGLAIDITPLTRTLGIFYRPDYSDATFEQIAKIAQEIGLEWGFYLWGFDKPHFMYTEGKTIQDMKDGAQITPPNYPLIYPTLDVPTKLFLSQQRQNLLSAGITFPL